MNHEVAESPTERRGRSSATVQPANRYLADDLVEFEATKAAEHLARLVADKDLVETLRWLSFDGTSEEWGKLAHALVEYGYSVFKGWFITGVVHQRAMARGIRGISKIPGGLRLNRDDAQRSLQN